MTKFPKVLAAARQIEVDQWALGDALIDECGAPSPSSLEGTNAHDGSYERLAEATEFLRENGLNYTTGFLARLRKVAFRFQGRNRKLNLAWSTHDEAREPELLNAVVAEAADKKKVTAFQVRDIRNAAEVVAARKDLAAIPPEYRAPEKRPDLAEPRIEPAQIVGLRILADVKKVERELGRINDALAADVQRIGEPERLAINEAFLAAAEVARRGASLSNPSKRGHLAAVGE